MAWGLLCEVLLPPIYAIVPLNTKEHKVLNWPIINYLIKRTYYLLYIHLISETLLLMYLVRSTISVCVDLTHVFIFTKPVSTITNAAFQY